MGYNKGEVIWVDDVRGFGKLVNECLVRDSSIRSEFSTKHYTTILSEADHARVIKKLDRIKPVPKFLSILARVLGCDVRKHY